MQAAQLAEHVRERLGERVRSAEEVSGYLVVDLEPDAFPVAARLCKEDEALAFDFFDFLSAVDEREQGFRVVAHLYSVRHGHHIRLQAIAPGGREAPVMPTITGVYRGANWHEREMWDMFGIVFDGHPRLEPRLYSVENFEGWPLRKEFRLATRDAKPWPGAKEPEEQKHDGEPGSSATPAEVASNAPVTADDKAAAAKAKAERAKAKAAEMRAKKAAERAAAQMATGEEAAAAGDATPGGDAIADAVEELHGGDTEGIARAQAMTAAGEPEAATPEGAAELAGTGIAMDAAAGASAGDTEERAPQDKPGVDTPVVDEELEAAYGEGAPPRPGGSPGATSEGRTGGAEDQGVRPVHGDDGAPLVPPPGSDVAPLDDDPDGRPDGSDVRGTEIADSDGEADR